LFPAFTIEAIDEGLNDRQFARGGGPSSRFGQMIHGYERLAGHSTSLLCYLRNREGGNEEEDQSMIARRWRGKVRAADHDAYLRYVQQSGVAALRATAGNEGVVIYRHLDRDAATSE